MRDLVDLLDPKQGQRITYLVATVTNIQNSTGTVTISLGSRIAAGIPYLRSYVPTVGDKVHVLAGESIGLLILGRTTRITGITPPSTRTITVPAVRSMNWSEDAYLGTNGVAAEGLVKQGGNPIRLHSGAYTYLPGTITLATGETIVKSELLLSRVDPTANTTVSPILHELTNFSSEGKPNCQPQRYFLPRDMRSGDVAWTPIPVEWGDNVAYKKTQGIVFAPSCAQLAYTYSEYASFDVSMLGATAGTIRLTIQRTFFDGVVEPPPVEGGGGDGGGGGVGNVIAVYRINDTTWPSRPNTVAPPDVVVLWIGIPPAPAIGGTTAMIDDLYFQTDF